MSEITEIADMIRRSGAVFSLQQKLAPLTVYELRALYYICRACQVCGHETEPGERLERTIVAMIGTPSSAEALHLFSVLMDEMSERDPDIIVRQALQDHAETAKHGEGQG